MSVALPLGVAGGRIWSGAITDARAFFEERAADLDNVCYQAEFPYWSKARRGGA